MGPEDLVTLRTALLITLGIVLIAVLFRRFKKYVQMNDTPAPIHAQLLDVNVGYHPPRIFVLLDVPGPQMIMTHLLNQQHERIHEWTAQELNAGEHSLTLELPKLPDGPYFVEMSTATQRTVRQFRLVQA